MKLKVAMLIVLVVASACAEHPVSVAHGAAAECEQGDATQTPSGERVCLYRPEIVIETGFRCPMQLANRLDFRNFSVCADKPKLPRIDLDFLHRNFDVPPTEPWRLAEASPAKLDLMWVIDNSGSFCQEQREIREGFREFASALAEEGIDFHVAVTTTQTDGHALEPVARPGHFQSTPQPLPGFDESCIYALDDQGEPIVGDFQPVREAIELAVSCMENPTPERFSFSDLEIECALENHPDCEFVNKTCVGNCDASDLFPAPSEYRKIPKVLKASTYRGLDGRLNVEQLRSDFACASMVGTRGYGFEKGLEAAVLALSPELTGGVSPGENSAPNHGFLRDDARLAVLFATDENDCSHDGSLDEGSVCGSKICDYAASPDWEGPSPLVPVETLRRKMLANLSESKGREVSAGEVFVANFVGRSEPYAGPVANEMLCANDHAAGSVPTCVSSRGSVSSGDRYDTFARSFPLANVYPRPDYEAPDTPLEGLLCSSNPFTQWMPELGAFLGTAGY